MSRFAPKHAKKILILGFMAGFTSICAVAQTSDSAASAPVLSVPQTVAQGQNSPQSTEAENLQAAPQALTGDANADTAPAPTIGQQQPSVAANQPSAPKVQPTAATAQPSSEQAISAAAAAPEKKHNQSVPPPFHISSRFSRAVQKYTGLTMVSDFVASQAADHVLSKKLHGKVKVKVKSYSLTDLIAGKVKSVRIKTAGGAYKDVPVGALELASETPIWYQYHSKNGEKAGLKTPIMLDVKAQLDNKTVVQALESQKIAQSLHGLKLDLPGLGEQQLQVVHPKVDFKENAIRIDATLITVGGAEDTGVPIVISGTPELKGDKIFITGMKVESPYIMEPDKFAAFASELLNPIFDFSRLDRKDHAFRLKELAVKGDSVQGDGQLLIAPRVQSQIAAKAAP